MGAALGTAAFFVLAPGVMGGLLPWLITDWDVPPDHPGWAVGLGLTITVASAPLVVTCFARFVREGRGTPAPVAPTEHLVVGGLYRWVRNPMYLAVAAMIGGQALIFASVGVLFWLVLFGVAVWSFVTLYEQPTLQRCYGAEYADYRAAVPG